MTSMLDMTGSTPAVDRAAAQALRTAIVRARRELQHVLADRRHGTGRTPSWTGGARRHHDERTAELLTTGRALDVALGDLLAVVDHELALLDAPLRWPPVEPTPTGWLTAPQATRPAPLDPDTTPPTRPSPPASPAEPDPPPAPPARSAATPPRVAGRVR